MSLTLLRLRKQEPTEELDVVLRDLVRIICGPSQSTDELLTKYSMDEIYPLEHLDQSTAVECGAFYAKTGTCMYFGKAAQDRGAIAEDCRR